MRFHRIAKAGHFTSGTAAAVNALLIDWLTAIDDDGRGEIRQVMAIKRVTCSSGLCCAGVAGSNAISQIVGWEG